MYKLKWQLLLPHQTDWEKHPLAIAAKKAGDEKNLLFFIFDYVFVKEVWFSLLLLMMKKTLTFLELAFAFVLIFPLEHNSMSAVGVPFYPDTFTRALLRIQNEACIEKISEAIFFCNLDICVKCQELISARSLANGHDEDEFEYFGWPNNSNIFSQCPLDCFDNDAFYWCSGVLLDKVSPSIV